MKFLKRVNTVMEKAVDWLMGIFLFIMCVGVALQMILRFFFNTSILQTEDIIKFSFSWLIFMGVAALFRKDEHIAVSALVDALPRKAGEALYVVQRVVTFVFLVGFFVLGLEFSITGLTAIGSQLMIPLFWIYISVPLAALAGILFYVEYFAERFGKRRVH